MTTPQKISPVSLEEELRAVIEAGRLLTAYATSVITLGADSRDAMRSLVRHFEDRATLALGVLDRDS